MVETDGEWLRILGRKSDVINVGGEKVLPSEVEAVIKELAEVAEVAVAGEPHPILGNIVTASIRMAAGVDETALRAPDPASLPGAPRPVQGPGQDHRDKPVPYQ
jgi:long-chain acyl-CoA synthetase